VTVKISQKEVESVAELARLQISEGEKEQLSHQLSCILTYMEELNQVDTEGVLTMASVVSQANVLREDEVRESVPQEKAVGNAPAAKDGLFQVPKIISDR
jgi:aspartyl-tRNA(Asn)/glutamyl-tRNA(Gln) amidotransferase subunit C